MSQKASDDRARRAQTRNFARTGEFWEQKFGCNNQGVIAAFFIAEKEKKALPSEENIISREEKRGLNEERRALEDKFTEEHKKDSNEELLDIVRKKAEELGRAPKKHEVIGFVCIKMRFGPWPRVLEKAGLKTRKTKTPKNKG